MSNTSTTISSPESSLSYKMSLPLSLSSRLEGLYQYLNPFLSQIISKLPPSPIALSVAVATYLLVVQLMRFRLENKLLAEYPYKTRDSFKCMTNEHAFEIQRDIFEREFPWISTRALEFALFKTYGIPTISRLLVQTKQLSTEKFSGKRAVDTGVIITEFIGYSPSSERANGAISRMNWQHAQYQKSGKISNDDMLFTLALFALEPRKWIKKYEWRSLNEMEECAIGVFWKSIGDAMGISYRDMKSTEKGWVDGLHWLDELEVWTEAYERRYMVPDDANHQTANHTLQLLIYGAPKWMFPYGRNLAATLMNDRLRIAMKYPPAPAKYYYIKNIGLGIRRFFLRHLALPRFKPFLVISEKADPKTGRYYRTAYESEPWYVRDTLTERWSPQALFRWIFKIDTPGKSYQPQGYHIHEIGPENAKNKGYEEFKRTRDELMAQGRGGCPFAVGLGRH